MSTAIARAEVELEIDEQDDGSAAGSRIPCEEGADWNVIERAFLTRRSIRKFKKAQVPAHLVRRMLEIGRFAPSQGNCQPWRFAVVREPGLLRGMEEFCVAECRKLAATCDYTAHEKGSLKRYAVEAVARLATANDPNALHPVPMQVLRQIAAGEFMVFHRAPTVILLLVDKHGVGVPEIDIGIVGTNIVMAAESQGIGTCWVGFSKLLNNSKEWRERLGLDDRFQISEAICVGYAVGKPWRRVIDRATHDIQWFENGQSSVVF
ncbi:MAG TPA: nitroreductase family protein [Candidatus Binatia bacterium]